MGETAESAETKRSQIPVRTTPKARARLQDAAKAAGRSLTQEIEQRLERSLLEENALGGPRTASFFQAAAALIQRVEDTTKASWLDDFETWSAVHAVLPSLMEAWQPLPPNSPEAVSAAREKAQKEEKFGQAYDKLREAVGVVPTTGLASLMYPEHLDQLGDPQKHADGTPRSAEEIEAIQALIDETTSAAREYEAAKARHDAVIETIREIGRRGEGLANQLVQMQNILKPLSPGSSATLGYLMKSMNLTQKA